jgi:hypothetical protein
VSIVPDSKDWTWVLERACPECGFDSRAVTGRDVPALLRVNARAWSALLARDGVRTRPNPGTWSTLEYACHVRDVFRVYLYRLGLMRTEDDPSYPNWDQDETAVHGRYGEQDPAVVRTELAAAAEELAAAFDAVPADEWQRTGNRSDGARFTIETFARYFIHDPVHHLHDVTATGSNERRT